MSVDRFEESIIYTTNNNETIGDKPNFVVPPARVAPPKVAKKRAVARVIKKATKPRQIGAKTQILKKIRGKKGLPSKIKTVAAKRACGKVKCVNNCASSKIKVRAHATKKLHCKAAKGKTTAKVHLKKRVLATAAKRR
ncbi:unnamed protein product [Mesocestoides corti]|uniref:H15 domain-containing protein n=1 Tax=Mesocestoides corti TaxID=53468 RepID=A0A0R3UAP2_MESCO|nr:unnamed protein product [Mesocestoides corti]